MFLGFVLGSCKSEKSVFEIFQKKEKYQAHFLKPKYKLYTRTTNSLGDTASSSTNQGFINSELLVSETHSLTEENVRILERENNWEISDQEKYLESILLSHVEDESENKKDRRKTTKKLDILAGFFGLGAIISIFSYSPLLFLGFGIGAVVLALISKSYKPKKPKLEKPQKKSREIHDEKPESIPEPLTNEERESLEIERFGFFSSVSGIFAFILTIMAISGAYLFGSIALFIPFFAAASLLFGFISLKKFKDNPRKFRGKGFMYTGIGIGLLYALLTLLVFILYVSFFLY